jgi:hypothetical protein
MGNDAMRKIYHSVEPPCHAHQRKATAAITIIHDEKIEKDERRK